MHRAVEVLWLSGTAAGYTDLFPIEELVQDVAGAERLHLVRGPHGGGHHARYKLTIAGLTATTVDYGAFADFNVRNGMEVGVMTFEFADSDRSVVRAVRWNKEPVGSSEATITTRASNEPVAAGAVIAKQQQTIAEQVLRPGQAEFRQLLVWFMVLAAAYQAVRFRGRWKPLTSHHSLTTRTPTPRLTACC